MSAPSFHSRLPRNLEDIIHSSVLSSARPLDTRPCKIHPRSTMPRLLSPVLHSPQFIAIELTWSVCIANAVPPRKLWPFLRFAKSSSLSFGLSPPRPLTICVRTLRLDTLSRIRKIEPLAPPGPDSTGAHVKRELRDPFLNSYLCVSVNTLKT